MLGSKFTKFLSFLKQKIFKFCTTLYTSLTTLQCITPLYLFSWNFIYFQRKEPIKVQIWWIFTWAVGSLKFSTLVGSFCKNHINFQLKMYRDLSVMTMKSDAKFKEKLTCGFKYDMGNLVNFHPTTQKSKSFTFMGYFCPKHMKFELKKCRGVIFKNTEQWYKVWMNPDLVVSKMAWRFGWTFIRAPKSLKNCTLKASFCSNVSNVEMFQFENFRELCVMTLKGVAKFKDDIRSLVNSRTRTWKSENLQFNRILLTKAYKDLDEKVQMSYVS